LFISLAYLGSDAGKTSRTESQIRTRGKLINKSRGDMLLISNWKRDFVYQSAFGSYPLRNGCPAWMEIRTSLRQIRRLQGKTVFSSLTVSGE
jgi:hypothetical protein